MSNFTSVDLSKLPPPTVVEPLDFEAIFAAMLADLRARDSSFDALVESDPAYAILQVCAFRELTLRQRVNDAAKAVMLASAIGSDLDQLGALLGVTRFQLDAGDPNQGMAPTWETDTDFRRRITLAPEGYSVAGPEGAYIYHALSADPDVLDASATSPSPGEVVVNVLSRTGTGAASQTLLDTVNAALSAQSVRPLTDHVTVQSAAIVSYSIQATIYTYAGPDSAVVLAAAEARLDEYIEQAHRMGRDVPLSGIYGALQTAGVQRVELATPTANLTINSSQASWCTGVTITYGGIDD